MKIGHQVLHLRKQNVVKIQEKIKYQKAKYQENPENQIKCQKKKHHENSVSQVEYNKMSYQ